MSNLIIREILDGQMMAEQCEPSQVQAFIERFGIHGEKIWQLLEEVYTKKSTNLLFEKLTNVLLTGYLERSNELKTTDSHLIGKPWYKDNQAIGMACYVDRFAKDLKGLRKKLPYFKSLGVTFLHLLPLFESPEGENDGGYAVSDYRRVNPSLGDMDELKLLIQDFKNEGIHIVLDFIFNHTSEEHRWALRAKQGDKKYQDYYHLFDTREVPDQYDPHLREIFPHVRRGCFSYHTQINKWVWTTFNSYQWDLNYSNPEVLFSVAKEMLFLANTGCDVLRLDALSFIWKDEGTNCESRPNAYNLINLLNLVLKISAPSVVFKSEAIVHPDDVAKYISPDRCQLSYHPLLMGLLWSSLATSDVEFMSLSLDKRFQIDDQCAWVNYVRCHDDIGWFFDESDAKRVGLESNKHIKFLNQFYTNQEGHNFPSGVAFQNSNEEQDARLCGSLASLCGLERAIEKESTELIDKAIDRILLLHSVILSIGGVPLIYSGDELGLLNDYSYLNDKGKQDDARWVNRPLITEESIKNAENIGTPQNRIFSQLKRMIHIRKRHSVFGDANTKVLSYESKALFVFCRELKQKDELIVVCNFSDLPESFDLGSICSSTCSETYRELMSDVIYQNSSKIELSPYQFIWLLKQD